MTNVVRSTTIAQATTTLAAASTIETIQTSLEALLNELKLLILASDCRCLSLRMLRLLLLLHVTSCLPLSTNSL